MARLFPSDNPDFEVTVSTRTVLRIIGLVALSIIAFAAIRQSVHTLTLIGIAVFLSLAFNGPVRWLANHLPGRSRGSRALATGISIFIIAVMLAGFIAAIVPPLVKQTSSFIDAAPGLLENIKNQDSGIGKFIRDQNLEGQVNKLASQLSSRLGDIGGSAFTTLGTIGSSIFATLTVIVLTVMMILEGPHWRRIFLQLIPQRHTDRTERLAHDMNKVIRGFVNGQVVLAAIASLLIVPILFIMHVPYPLALMVIVFICGLIPMVGHTIGAIIVTTVALFESPLSAIIVLTYYILYQQIENYAVQPRIQANSTNMSPLLVFIAVILGASFGGLLGALVAIPVAGCLRIVVLDYLEYRNIISSETLKKVTTPKKPKPAKNRA
ncbi:AI-2E family transporter [Candidatus Saccharibacteria bacterium]|nr:MAG: AI-2E family transporter [Candidatus Saccharibacteria bacterium]